MRQIRKGVFETNSSSTHAICISDGYSDDVIKNYENSFMFYASEYGWDNETYYGLSDYLYTLACDFGDEEHFKGVAETYLNEVGITDIEYEKSSWSYVDHSNYAQDFYNWALESKENFFRCLFGDSFVKTGNDNSDGSYDDVCRAYHSWTGMKFFKGN